MKRASVISFTLILGPVLLILPVSAWGKGSDMVPTESQQILAKVMDDIRSCDMSIRYEYNQKTHVLHPPEIKNIKGFKLRYSNKEVSVFDINETYLGLKANVLTIGSHQHWVNGAPHKSVAFLAAYPLVRHQLERSWKVRFQDTQMAWADFADATYSQVEIVVSGKRRLLSLTKMPATIRWYTTLPEVDCNQGDF